MPRIDTFDRRDCSSVLRWTQNEREHYLWTGPELPYPLSLERFEEHVDRVSASNSLVLAGRIDGALVAYLEVGRILKVERSARLERVLVNPQSRDQKVGQTFVKGVLTLLFRTNGVHRVDLVVSENNASAIACYQACGFQIEGTHRDARLLNGEWLALKQMSILEEEWAVD